MKKEVPLCDYSSARAPVHSREDRERQREWEGEREREREERERERERQRERERERERERKCRCPAHPSFPAKHMVGKDSEALLVVFYTLRRFARRVRKNGIGGEVRQWRYIGRFARDIFKRTCMSSFQITRTPNPEKLYKYHSVTKQ